MQAKFCNNENCHKPTSGMRLIVLWLSMLKTWSDILNRNIHNLFLLKFFSLALYSQIFRNEQVQYLSKLLQIILINARKIIYPVSFIFQSISSCILYICSWCLLWTFIDCNYRLQFYPAIFMLFASFQKKLIYKVKIISFLTCLKPFRKTL